MFPFEGIILHTSNNINSPAEHLQALLKLLSMFKLRFWHDDIIAQENVSDAVVIMCINCGKTIGCLLDNKKT